MVFKTACATMLSIHPSTTYINLSQIGRTRLSKVYIKSIVPYMEWLICMDSVLMIAKIINKTSTHNVQLTYSFSGWK